MEPNEIIVTPTFVLLFSIRLRGDFTGFGSLDVELNEIPPNDATSYMDAITESERRLLGVAFLRSGRLTRWPLGRVILEGLGDEAPSYADVHLLTHKSGVATWEILVTAPPQGFDARSWIGWLDAESDAKMVGQLWRVLGPINLAITGESAWSGLYFPLTSLGIAGETLENLIERHDSDIVRLLFRDSTALPFKPDVVRQELAGDYCLRQGGMTLLARRSGIDVHENSEGASGDEKSNRLPRQSFLSFLITIELLVLEQAVLRYLYDRLTLEVPKSLEELIALKDAVGDGLQEYSGVITNATRMTDAITADGEVLLGLEDMYDAVMNRLEAVSFTITTQSQRHMTIMEFWLTVVFGAAEIGFLGASIATWYYRTGIGVVLAWTAGSSIIAGLTLIWVLKGKID
jgi:hypothetical protein